jgi:ABC-type amino acid transport substrate-binding protein
MKKLLIAALINVALIFSTNAQDSTITIGVESTPPFILMEDDGNLQGLSADFWDLVEDDAQLKFKYQTYPSLTALLSAVKSGEVDMSINPITVTDSRMREMDFSQPFYISGTTVARKYQSNWWGVLKNIFSWQFISAVAVLLFVIFIFGALIWHFERKRNKEQFGSGFKGLADGFWWSAVTMTTVGYGDKAPITRGGRIVGFIWMFAAIIMISGLTAGIASALTVQSLDSKINSPEDLRRFSVATIAGSSTADYLGLFDVGFTAYNSLPEVLEALNKDEVEVVVYDRPILQHYLNQGDFGDIVLSTRNLKTDYYSFSFPKNSELRNYVDPFVVKTLKSPQWSYKLRNLEKED